MEIWKAGWPLYHPALTNAGERRSLSGYVPPQHIRDTLPFISRRHNLEDALSNPEQTSRSATAHPAAPAALAALTALLVYVVTLAGGFAYDFYGIIESDAKRLQDPSQWRTFWTQSYNGGVDNLYRPL